MRVALALFLLALTLALPGCYKGMGNTAERCIAYDDSRPWRRLDEPPPNAPALRLLADATGQPPGSAETRIERWIELPTGELRLCRTDDERHSNVGAWWEFSTGPNPVIVNSDGWLYVTVG